MSNQSKKTENSGFRMIQQKGQNNTVQQTQNQIREIPTKSLNSDSKQDTNRKKIFDLTPQCYPSLRGQTQNIFEQGCSDFRTLYQHQSITSQFQSFKYEQKPQSSANKLNESQKQQPSDNKDLQNINGLQNTTQLQDQQKQNIQNEEKKTQTQTSNKLEHIFDVKIDSNKSKPQNVIVDVKLPEFQSNVTTQESADLQEQPSNQNHIEQNNDEQSINKEGVVEQLLLSQSKSNISQRDSEIKEQNSAQTIEIKEQNLVKTIELKEQNFAQSIEFKEQFNQDEKNNQKPVKINNFIPDENQLQQAQKFQSKMGRQVQNCQIFNEEFKVLIEMNEVRQQRIKNIDYISQLMNLKDTDCISDLYTSKQKADIILVQFPLIRRVRGDGNCLYSSLVFPYLELLHRKNQFMTILNLFEAQQILWNGEVIIEIPMVYQLIKQIFQKLNKLSEQCVDDFNKFSQTLLHYFNKENGFYDLMIIFIRSLVFQSFCKYYQNEQYRNFIPEDLEEEFKQKITTFEEEGDFMVIQLFSEITQIKIKLINFTDNDPLQQMTTVQPKININTKTQDSDKLNFITLKYNNGHYDILYSQMQKYVQIKECKEQLKIDFTPLY